MMFDFFGGGSSGMPHSAREAAAQSNRMEEERMLRAYAEQQRIAAQNAPVIRELQAVIAETKEQNKKLSEQIELQKEENERQKQEILQAKEREKKVIIRSWISIGLAILSIVATIVIAIVK